MSRDANCFEGLPDRHFERLLVDCPTCATADGTRVVQGQLCTYDLRIHTRREGGRQGAVRAECGAGILE